MRVLRNLTLIGVYLQFGMVVAYLEEPPTSAAPDTVQDCSWWHVAESGDSCGDIALENGITLSDFSNVYVSSSALSRNAAMRS